MASALEQAKKAQSKAGTPGPVDDQQAQNNEEAVSPRVTSRTQAELERGRAAVAARQKDLDAIKAKREAEEAEQGGEGSDDGKTKTIISDGTDEASKKAAEDLAKAKSEK